MELTWDEEKRRSNLAKRNEQQIYFAQLSD